MKLVVLDAGTLDLPEDDWNAVFLPFEEVEFHTSTPHIPSVVLRRCWGATVVLTNKVPISGDMMRDLPTLEMIGTLATGYNVIDVQGARECGITVCNVPAYSTAAVAQHTTALILAMTNQVAEHTQSVRRGDWTRSEHFCYWLHDMPELAGGTIGLIGWGSIARHVAQVMHALGMKVIVHTRSKRRAPDWEGFAFVGLSELCERADIVSIHCPLTEKTVGMFDARRLRSMKRDACIVNTARGGIIVEEDLAMVLREGHLRGAALDVIETEPMPENHPLQDVPRLWITPHIGWASAASRRRLLAITAGNIRAFMEGHPENVVS